MIAHHDEGANMTTMDAIRADISESICSKCESPAVGQCYLCPLGDDLLEGTIHAILDAVADN